MNLLENLKAKNPFQIIIDTREQTPLPFAEDIPTVCKTQYPGDYSLVGYEARWFAERKSVDDLVGSLIGHKKLKDGERRNNRDRLIEELLQMRALKPDFCFVVVTGPIRKLEQHQYRSQIAPNALLGLIWSIEALTGVPFRFFDDAEQAARWVAGEAWHYWRRMNGMSNLNPVLRRKVSVPCPPPPLGIAYNAENHAILEGFCGLDGCFPHDHSRCLKTKK